MRRKHRGGFHNCVGSRDRRARGYFGNWRNGLIGPILASLLTPALAQGQTAALDAALTVELNKLEEAENACRAYLVFENKSERTFSSFKLDLVMFGADGVITKRLAVEGAPLPAGKTSVKLFEIGDLSCASIGRILLNDVISCQDNQGDHDDCVERVSTATRSSVSFFK